LFFNDHEQNNKFTPASVCTLHCIAVPPVLKVFHVIKVTVNAKNMSVVSLVFFNINL